MTHFDHFTFRVVHSWERADDVAAVCCDECDWTTPITDIYVSETGYRDMTFTEVARLVSDHWNNVHIVGGPPTLTEAMAAAHLTTKEPTP